MAYGRREDSTQTSDTDRSSAPSVSARLPDGWVPDGVGVWVVSRASRGAKRWEALLPQFSVAGRGDSWREALDNALDLLEDYLALCAADGRSFEGCCRSVDRAWRSTILREMLLNLFSRRRPQTPEHNYLRLPMAAR